MPKMGLVNDETWEESPLISTEKAKTKKLTMLQAMLFITGEIAGSGISVLAYSIYGTGWIGIAVLVYCCACSGYAGVLLGKCWLILCNRSPEEYNHECRDPFARIGKETFGTVGKVGVSICIDVTLFGTGVVFLLLSSQNVAQVVSHFGGYISPCYVVLIAGGILIPLMWLGTPKDFWPVAVIATLTTVVACILVLAAVGVEPNTAGLSKQVITPMTFFAAFGTILFSFGGAPAFPTIQADMEQPQLFSRSVFWGFLGLILMYVPVASVGYAVLGDNVNANILESLTSSWMLYTVEVLLTVHLIFAFVIISNPPCQEIENYLNVPSNFNWKRALVRTLYVSFIVFVAESVPKFGSLLSLIGGSTNSLLTFVLPCLFYLRLLSQEKKNNPDTEWRLELHELVFCVQVIVVGIVGGVAATVSAVEGLASPNSLTVPCYININVPFS